LASFCNSIPVETRNRSAHEGDILRFVFLHSLALAALMGLLVMLQAYVFPFTLMVAK
jgi:L-lactate permease